MTVIETILVYGVIPLAFVLLMAVLTGFGNKDRPARYKPGAPWDHPDIWWEPHPGPGAHGAPQPGELVAGYGEVVPGPAGSSSAAGGSTALGARRPGALPSALAIGETPHGGPDVGGAPRRTAGGGARGTW